MGVGEAILLITSVLSGVVQIADYLTDDEPSETTVYNFANSMWTGYAFYNWRDNNGNTSVERAVVVFNPNNLSGGKVVFTGPHVTVRAVRTQATGGNAPSCNFTVNQVILNGWYYYTFECTVAGQTVPVELSSGSTGTVYVSSNYSSNTYYEGMTSISGSLGNIYAFNSTAEAAKNQTILTTSPELVKYNPQIPYVPAGNYTYDDLRRELIDYYNKSFDLNISYDDPGIPTYEELQGETESETGTGNCGSCGTNVTVDAEGNVYIDGNQVDLTLIAGAGAFGAGAFGAGAIGQVNVNGELSIDGSVEFSGDINGDLVLNGGDVVIEHSGDNITNNYYVYDPSEQPVEMQPFTLDYNEILSEGELESILNQETYYLAELNTYTPDLAFDLPIETLPEEQITLLVDTLNMSWDFWDGLGLSSVLIALGVLACLLKFIRGY